MNKRILFLLLIFLPSALFADEGMWLLPLLNQLNTKTMHELGLKLEGNDIYDTAETGLKDAIVIFDGGCTGEIVSDQGLLFTNHHCGYDQIQSHSTLEHNYLKDGFWADSLSDELPNPGCEVLFLERTEDVTEKIYSQLSDTLSSESRITKINELSNKIATEASDSGKFQCMVNPLYEGNKYYLYVYLVYKDVRLVAAPPSSIGKFGFDTDNWVWPRHTGDFSIFRVYTAPDGSPAEYSPDNIPLKPKKYLNISLGGVKNGDFTFVLGYPGETNRYMNSGAILHEMNVDNEIRIKVKGERLKLLNEAMEADSLVQIKYSAKYYRSSNAWKYAVGQNKEIAKNGLIGQKMQEEKMFQNWCLADSARNAKYGKLLSDMDDLYNQIKPSSYNFKLITEAFFMSSEITDLASDFYYLNLLLNRSDSSQNEIADEIIELRKRIEIFYKDFDISVDKMILKSMIKLYANLNPSSSYPAFYDIIRNRYRGNVDRYVDKALAHSIFISREKLLSFLDKPKSDVLANDMIFKLSLDILTKYFEIYGQFNTLDTKIKELNRLYMKARMEKEPEKFQYPDADFTMRLSYGTVKDYYPREAVHYDYFTTLKGVIEKEDSTDYEFMVPLKLKELYRNSDYGKYGQDSTMPVCFITNNDITGGNSGSPVLNSKGELIGIAFDGNWEAMSSDFVYNNSLQRCICVDIRYVLFIIDKFACANRILKELKIYSN